MRRWLIIALALGLAGVLLSLWLARDETAPETSISSNPRLEAAARDPATQPLSPPSEPASEASVREPAATVSEPVHAAARRDGDGDGDGSGAMTVLHGRILAPDGAILASSDVQWTVVRLVPGTRARVGRSQVAASAFRGTMLTSNAGDFEIQVERPRKISDSWRELVVEARGLRGSASIHDLESERVDVGVITLVAANPLLAGVVVDENGVGIPDVRISVVDRSDPGGVQVLRFGFWPKVSTDAEGQFELRAATDATHLTLWASHPKHQPIVMEGLVVPTLDLRIVAEPSKLPSIVATVQVDGACAPFLELFATFPGPPVNGLPLLLRRIDEQTWELASINEGAWDVSVRVADVNVLMLERVQVPATGRSLDPRLDPVDLRGLVECIRFEVLDAAGNSIPHRYIATADGETFSADAAGVVTVARKPGTRTVVVARGGRHVLVEDGQSVIVDG